MTRALTLRENQVRAIIRAARKEGARVEVKIGEATVIVGAEGDEITLPAKKPVDEKGKGYL